MSRTRLRQRGNGGAGDWSVDGFDLTEADDAYAEVHPYADRK